MPKSGKPVMNHIVYRPIRGKEEELLTLIKRHWPALHRAGLATFERALVYRASDRHTGREFFVEIFSWRDQAAIDSAHQLPEVMAIWEPMSAIIEGGGSPEIANVEPVAL